MDNSLDSIFGKPEVDPKVTLYALGADMAVIKHQTTETAKRLDSIERIMSDIQELATTQASHEERLKRLEIDLIPNGQLRMANLEKTRTGVLTLCGTVAMSGIGWFVVTFIGPLFHHHP